MQEQSGNSYIESKYAKSLVVADSKDGKTTHLVASCLGLLPYQHEGGIVDRPEHLHVMTFDSSALGKFKDFAIKKLSAKPETLNYHVYNFQDDVRRIAESSDGYQHDLMLSIIEARDKIAERAAKGGTHALVVSSLTGLALAVERALFGRPTGTGSSGRGYGSIDLWTMLAAQLFEIQNLMQVDSWHCFWEGHLYRPASGGVGDDGAQPKETIQVRGKAGQSWGYNVEQVFRLRRMYGHKAKGADVDMCYLDTQPSLDFIANGRGFSTALNAKEWDMTATMRKLGLKVGHWGHQAKPVAKSTGNMVRTK